LHKLEEPLRKMIVANLAAGSAEQVSRFLDQFVANVSAGAIAGLGVLVLFYSVVGMVVNAENSFNAIWGVRRGRPFLLRFAIYWALLTVAPAVVAFSISVTANLQQSPRVRELLGLMPEGLLPAGMRVGMQAASLLGVCFAFTLALVIIPHTRVRFRAAVAGGVVGGVIWHLSKMLYVYLSATAFRYSAIYGALGALPIFMIWIYVSWLIVLFAATYAYHVQQGIGVAPHARATLGSASQQYRERLSLNLCVALAAGLRTRQPLATARELAMGAGAPLSLVAELLHELALARLLIEVPARVGGGWTSHGDGRKSYTLAIDPHEATPAEVVALLREKLGASYPLATSDRQDQLEELLRRADQAAARILSEPRLATLAGSVQSQQR
jgi:membrane protein